MTTAQVSRPTATRQVPWSAMTMVVAILLSVAMLVAASPDIPAETAPMRLPAAPAADSQIVDNEPVPAPAPAPAPQPGRIR